MKTDEYFYSMTVEEVVQKYRHNRTKDEPVDLRVEYLDEINPYGYPNPMRPVKEPIVPWRKFGKFIWGWLQYRIQHNDINDFHIGDWVELHMQQPEPSPWNGDYGSDTYHMEISYIGDDYIDFISKELVPYKRAWNTHTSCGHTQNMPIPWVNWSFIHHYLNGEFFDSLFGDYSDIRETIIEKRSVAEVRYLMQIPPNLHDKPKFDVREYRRNVNVGKLWLPSIVETFGEAVALENKVSFLYGHQYKTLDTLEKRIKKCLREDSPSVWPTLSTANGCFTKVVGVDNRGELCEISVDTEVGFPICFRIG